MTSGLPPSSTNPFNPCQVEAAGPSVGTVKNVVFYGNQVEYEIETAEGLIGAVVSDPTYGDIVQIGEMAKFDFDSSRCWLLPA